MFFATPYGIIPLYMSNNDRNNKGIEEHEKYRIAYKAYERSPFSFPVVQKMYFRLREQEEETGLPTLVDEDTLYLIAGDIARTPSYLYNAVELLGCKYRAGEFLMYNGKRHFATNEFLKKHHHFLEFEVEQDLDGISFL